MSSVWPAAAGDCAVIHMGATKERAAVIMGSARKQIQAKNRVMQETSF
jgi:hypothetical protein